MIELNSPTTKSCRILLMIGTDYSRTDICANLSALHKVRGWADEGRISNAQAQKILEGNSQAFYGL